MSKKFNYHNLFKNIILAIFFLIMFSPIISLVFFSFNSGSSLTRFQGFSLRWYKEMFQNQQMMDSLVVTLVIAIISTLVSVIIGTLGALALDKFRNRAKNLVLAANNIPIVNPEIITAIAMFVLYGTFLIPFGYITLILAHIAFSTPYVIITVYPKISSLDPNIADAALDLGATPFQTIYKVILPQIRVSVVAAAAIAFTMSFDDFVISYFSAGSSGVQNISIYLYTLKRGVNPQINALSTFIVIIVLMKIFYDYFIGFRRKNNGKEYE